MATALEKSRRHRAELRESASALEHALAGPAPGRTGAWVERVRAALMELLADFREHVDLAEGRGGLYADVLRSAPRLSSQVDRLTREHSTLVSALTELLEAVDAQTGDGRHVEVDDLRERGTLLLGDLVRHRQRGSDMVYEAYEVDIGGQD